MSNAIKKHLGPYIDQKAEQMAEQRVQEALRKEKIDTILTSFSLGLPIDLIAQIKQVSVDEVKDILKHHQALTD